MRKRIILSLWLSISVLFISSCNIFESFHEEGSSDDPETLLNDGISAYENGDYEKGLAMAEKGLEKDSTNADLLYLHAQCTLQKYGLDVAKVIEPFQIEGGSSLGKSTPESRPLQTALGDTTIIFDLSEPELARLYAAFVQVDLDLGRLISMIEDMSINSNRKWRYWYYYCDDIYLSFGITRILRGILRILDNDNTPSEFSLDHRVHISRIGSQYQVHIEDIPYNEINSVIQSNLPYFRAGRAALRNYLVGTLYPLNLPPYRNRYDDSIWKGFWNWYCSFLERIEAYPLPENPPDPLSFEIPDTPAGTIFEASHNLYVNLWQQVY